MARDLTGTHEGTRCTPVSPAELKSPFLESERAFHASLGGLSTDEQGREVLVGLTFDETLFYLGFLRAFGREKTRDTEVRDRHRSLRKRYEVARDGEPRPRASYATRI